MHFLRSVLVLSSFKIIAKCFDILLNNAMTLIHLSLAQVSKYFFYRASPFNNINTYLKIHINTRHSPFSVCTLLWVDLHGLVSYQLSCLRQSIPAARFLLTKQNEDRQVCACVANQRCQAETTNLKKNRPIFNNS